MTSEELQRIGDAIVNRLLTYPGVEERRSRFADRPALYFQGREFFHLDEAGLADVRLGRRTIRARVAELRSGGVELRDGSSDWVHIRFDSQSDVESVVRWAEVAIHESA